MKPVQWMICVSGLLVSGYVAFCALVAHNKAAVLYPNRGHERAEGRGAPSGYESWWRELPDGAGRVEAWWRPAAGASTGRPAPAVMYFQGNAELIDDQRQIADLWHSLGVSVLICEHVGYGRSAGVPRVENDIVNGAAWFDILAAMPEVRSDRIFAHGFWLGGAFAAQLASRRPVAGLVLESTFSSRESVCCANFWREASGRTPSRTKPMPMHGARKPRLPHPRWARHPEPLRNLP